MWVSYSIKLCDRRFLPRNSAQRRHKISLGDVNSMKGHRGTLRTVAIGTLLLLVAVGAWWAHRQGLMRPDAFHRLVSMHPLVSVALFILTYAISVLALAPTIPFNLAAGVLWGWAAGGCIASSGAALGAISAFLATRGLLGQPLSRRFSRAWAAYLQEEFEAKGWRFIAFIRLNPALPTGAINYVLGLSSITAWTYIWATAIFLLPPTFIISLLGDEMKSAVVKGGVLDIINLLIVASAAAVALVTMWYVARTLNRFRAKS